MIETRQRRQAVPIPRITPWLLVAVLLLACPAAVKAAGSGGTHAFEFVRLAAEPVGRCLVGAHLATVSGASSIAWNPGGLGASSGSCALLSHATWIAGSSWEWGAIAVELPRLRGHLGLSCGMLRSGTLDGYLADGTPTGDFSPHQLLATLGYGWPIGEALSLGLSIEMAADGDGEHEATRAWAFGGGLQLRLGRAGLGLTALHLAPGQRLGEDRFAMPATVRAAATLPVGRGVKLHGGVEMLAGEDPKILIAGAWRPVQRLSAYGGLRYDSAEMEEPIQESFGVSVEVSRLQVAYGFQPCDAFGSSHQVSISLPLSAGR